MKNLPFDSLVYGFAPNISVGYGTFLGGVAMHTRAVEHNVAMFQNLYVGRDRSLARS